MNKREWLRSQGFQVGERGRLNPAMLKALEGFEEEQPQVVEKKEEIQFFIPPDVVQRPTRTLYGYSREGYKVAFVLCFHCSRHMMYCKCARGITAPSSVVRSKEPDVYISTKSVI